MLERGLPLGSALVAALVFVRLEALAADLDQQNG
jgi:hypothetical protein